MTMRKRWSAMSLAALFAAALGFGATQALAAPPAVGTCFGDVFVPNGTCPPPDGQNPSCTAWCNFNYPGNDGLHGCSEVDGGACCICFL